MQKKLNVLSQILLLVIAGLILLPACGGDSGALGGIPEPPPDAQEIPDELLPADPDVMAETYQQQYDTRSLALTAYTLPVEVSFAAVKGYYQALLNEKWEPYNLDQTDLVKPEGMEVAIWANSASRELFSIQYAEAPQYGGNLLLVLYAEQ